MSEFEAVWEPIRLHDSLREHARGGRTGQVEIADVVAALAKVQAFIALLEENHRIGPTPGLLT
jgi:hypothetical protein